MLSEVKKKDVRVQKSTLILGGRGWGRQGKGISISTMQKGAILWKCVNTFVPHCSFFFQGCSSSQRKRDLSWKVVEHRLRSKAGTSPFPSDCCRASPFQLAHNSAMVASSTRCTTLNHFNYFLLMFMSWNSLTESSCWVGYLTVGDARK